MQYISTCVSKSRSFTDLDELNRNAFRTTRSFMFNSFHTRETSCFLSLEFSLLLSLFSVIKLFVCTSSQDRCFLTSCFRLQTTEKTWKEQNPSHALPCSTSQIFQKRKVKRKNIYEKIFMNIYL